MWTGEDPGKDRYAVEWSSGWLATAIRPTWRLTVEFEEEGIKFARTTIDCIPNDALLARMERRAAEGFPLVAQGLIWESARGAANAIRYQFLGETGVAENKISLRSPKNEEAADLIVSTQLLIPYDGNDKVLYLKEIPKIVDHLFNEAREQLSGSERDRMKQAGKEIDRLLSRRSKPKPVRVVVSDHDPIHFYVDESGDVGFKEGSSDYYTVAFFAIPSSKEPPIRDALRWVLQHCMPPGNEEIKFSRVDRYRTDKRDEIYRECLRILRSAPLILYATAVHKDGFVYEKVRSQMAIYYFYGEELPDLAGPLSLDRMREYPKEMLRSWGANTLPHIMGRLLIQARRTGRIFYDKLQWEWKNDLLRDGFKEAISVLPRVAEVSFGVACDIDLPLVLIDSKDEPLIWLSELVAREVNKHLLGMENYLDEFREMFAGAGPDPEGIYINLFPGAGSDPEGNYIALVDEHGRYTFYNLETKRVELVLPD